MNRDYWNAVADTYEAEIFNVLEHDTAGLIRDRVERHAGPDRIAADLGCGVGHCLPLLAGHFARIHACDLSADCLEQARRVHGSHPNLSFQVADLAQEAIGVPPVDFALCINVLITGSLSVRTRMLRNLRTRLRPGGHILIVVPSVESALLTSAPDPVEPVGGPSERGGGAVGAAALGIGAPDPSGQYPDRWRDHQALPEGRTGVSAPG